MLLASRVLAARMPFTSAEAGAQCTALDFRLRGNDGAASISPINPEAVLMPI